MLSKAVVMLNQAVVMLSDLSVMLSEAKDLAIAKDLMPGCNKILRTSSSERRSRILQASLFRNDT